MQPINSRGIIFIVQKYCTSGKQFIVSTNEGTKKDNVRVGPNEMKTELTSTNKICFEPIQNGGKSNEVLQA